MANTDGLLYHYYHYYYPSLVFKGRRGEMRGDHLEDEGLDDQRVVVVGLGAMVLKVSQHHLGHG